MDDTADTKRNNMTNGSVTEDGNEFSTEIRFEISAGRYDDGTGTDTVVSRSGIVKGMAAGIAKTALMAGLEVLLSRRTANKNDRT